MKLQRQVSRKLKGKEYTKWVLVLPSEKVAEVGLNEGDDLEVKVKGTALVIEKKKRDVS